MRFLAVAFVLLLSGLSQAQIGIGQWRDHLPYKKGIAVTFSSEKVWCATSGGLFEYHKNDNTVKRLGKFAGFSDVNPSDVKYNPYNNTLIVTYKNGNIDIVDGMAIINISDVKRAQIVGNKTINSVFLRNEFAYLATGFGIVVIDTKRKEVKDTYFIGTNGGNIFVRDITINTTHIYAATDSGVFRASLSSSNLANFTAWSKIQGLPQGKFNTICSFNNKVYVNYSKALTSNTYAQDTVYVFDGASWTHNFSPASGYNCYSIEAINSHIAFANDGYIDVYDANNQLIDHIWTYLNRFIAPRQAVMETPKLLWVADADVGLVRVENVWNVNGYAPSGPSTPKSYALDLKKEVLWVAPGERNELWDNAPNPNIDGIFSFSDITWRTINRESQTILDSIRDIVSVTINPSDPNQVFAGCLGKGLIEINNGTVTRIHNQYNSSLEVRGDDPNSGWVASFGSVFDKDGNLWVTNAKSNRPLSVKKAGGGWQSFSFGPNLQQLLISNVIVDQRGYKWCVLPRGGGLLVFDHGADISNTNDDRFKKLGTGSGNGGLPSAEVYSIVEDLDGEIWVGTDKGVAVFYSPENVFSGGNFDAQQIFVQQDGHTQILFETEIITSIAVDGANRKWVGTQNSGVFLISQDGQKEVYHFTENNSPLLSNSITSIAIDHKSGEVFFGTAKGIVSFRSTATEGGENFENVYAFPNPVRPDHNGIIAIRGLVKDCDVKITDISGVVVNATKSLGGTAIWDGKTFSGDRVHSGVYLVFCSTEDGSKTYVTKILVIN